MTLNFPDPSLSPLVIVDDCEDDIFLMRHRLREGGIANPIVAFDSTHEAMAYLEVMHAGGAKPAFVFIDIKLPRDEGFELISHVRALSDWEEVRIVVATSSNDDADLQRALDLHVDGYLIKFPPAELIAEFVLHGPWFAVPQRQSLLAAAS